MEMVCQVDGKATRGDTGDATRLFFLVDVGNIPQQERHNDKRWGPS
jgi:hypothetical protein